MSLIEESPSATVDALMTQVRRIPAQRKNRSGLITLIMLFGIIAGLLAIGAAGLLEIWSASVVIGLVLVSCIWWGVAADRRDFRKVSALAAFKEKRTVGVLLEALNYSNRRIRTAVESVLLELLPHVHETDAALLNTGQREILNSLLYSNSGELAITALAALEQVGDGTALPYLTSMAAGKGVPSTLRSRKTEIQERAAQTVQTIHARIERHNQASVLLRPTQIPTTYAEELVRPVQGQHVQGGTELLRPNPTGESASDDKEKLL